MKFPDPKTGEEAKFSCPHILGAAILKDGRVFSKEIASPREPTLDQLLDRYRQAADGVLTPDQTKTSIELLLNLENVCNISEIMECVCQS
ncbi:hypothetical protein ACFLZM_06570 [Thermodesulfobacteriota bacterium]